MIVTALLLLAAQAAPAIDATGVRLDPRVRAADVNAGKLKGEPSRLAWSADGTQLYLQIASRKSDGTVDARHYLVAATGGTLAAVDTQPAWADVYWAWKSAQTAPGAPAFKIAVASERQILRSTAAPRGGDIAGMGGEAGTSGGSGSGRVLGGENVTVGDAQNATVYRMLLHGDVIGEWVNAPIVPGETFGWSPEGLGLIAYANRDGKIVIADAAGRRTEIDGTAAASLPAWSEDGTKLAFLRKTGRRQYDLIVAGIGRQ